MPDFLLKPGPSFDEPIEMLKACHERIHSQCATLEKLAAHLPAHGADQQAQQAARNILRYFDIAGRNHHADEEENLFPMLRHMTAGEHAPVKELIGQLLDEHQALERNWAQLRPLLAEIAAGHAVALGWPQVRAFVSSYEQHIAREEAVILSYAEKHLNPQQLAELSAAMVARRTTR